MTTAGYNPARLHLASKVGDWSFWFYATAGQETAAETLSSGYFACASDRLRTRDTIAVWGADGCMDISVQESSPIGVVVKPFLTIKPDQEETPT